MRLIDADALKESLKELKAEGNNRRYVQGLQDAIDDYFPQIIDDEPTIDAEPVKHGRWIETNDDKKKRCSECDVIHLIAQYPHGNANYCPNCGAKMDGDTNNET